MKLLTVLFGVLLCIAVVNCRHYGERETEETSDETDHISKARDFAASQMRHRRKRWQNNYGYDYPQPPPFPYYLDRREYDRNNQDLLPQILRLLDEISTYVKRPPPPPQPIYIPYPVPYPVPQPNLCSCPTVNGTTPDINKRRKPEDSNRNWGLVDSNDENEYDDDGTDGARPISFEPIKPKRPMSRPVPKVEHGSSQANNDLQTRTTVAPIIPRSSSTCNIAILSCCNKTEQEQKACFTKNGCGMTYAKGDACSSESIMSALDSFKVAYAPVY